MEETRLPFEQFPALQNAGCIHAFVRRVPGIEVSHDKAETIARLDGVHREVRRALQLDDRQFVTAQQVHGNLVGIADNHPANSNCVAACDGLVTNRDDICLGIYVADCCAVFLVDPIRRCIGLVHSGKKGTELGIVPRAIEKMKDESGSQPHDLVVQLSPCIRPPHYEIDFAAEIVAQCRDAGVTAVHDCGICTASDLQHYYSYRAEKGRTGRMLALLALTR